MSGGSSIPPGERDGLAAEYVLGTLPAEERAALEAERQRTPAIDFAIRDWERRLAPLSLAAVEEAPPPRVWQAIERALAFAGPIANDNRIFTLQRQVRRWRLGAMGTGLAAAGLALALILPMRPGQEAASGRYVAVVTSGGELPALIVNVDTGTGIAQVRPVRAEAPSGRSLELWYVGAGKAPKTLGLIKAGANQVSLPVDAAVAEGMFAVSVEPTEGSPTGQPTGPVIYSGKLIQN